MSSSGPGAMDGRIVRYADLIPCRATLDSALDSRSAERETFAIIGEPLGDSADKPGFSIGGVRQPFGCVSVPYTRERPEVFIVHSGRWRLAFGPNGEDGALEMGPGDVASVPMNIYRRLERLDEGAGFLWTILSAKDPGGPFEAAAVPSVSGRTIDTSSGAYELKEAVLGDETEGPDPETPFLITAETLAAKPRSTLATDGVEEACVIAPGPITSRSLRGFNLRRLRLRTGAYVPMHTRREQEVFLVHEGAVEASWADGSTILAAGDTAIFPTGLPRAFRNTSSAPATIFVVGDADDPGPPSFLTAPSAA